MLKDGYTCTDRITFGSRLRKAVTEFTEKFIPHMAEEEEVFQPLLVKYFAREELLLLKEQVIQQHEIWKEKLLQQKETARVLLELLEKVDENGLQTLVDRTTEKFAQVKIFFVLHLCINIQYNIVSWNQNLGSRGVIQLWIQ